MRRKLRSPLAQRAGLDPVRIQLPDGHWSTIREHLHERLPRVSGARIDEKLRAGEFVGLDGPIGEDTPYTPGLHLWFHRDLPEEPHVPFDIPVVYRDERILVVHKPHFLATIPRGKHVRQTALVRLREKHGLPELSPAHRLDRATAGLVLFVIERAHRGAYQTLFRDRKVRKVYEAIAPADPALAAARTVRSRIVKERGTIAAFTEDGPPNSESRIELVESRDGLGRYRLEPATGRTHQLRLHMHELGVPILGDPFYPELTEKPLEDFSKPLQLLAKTLRFTDPITGAEHAFTAPCGLLAWESFAEWELTGSPGS
ncbi:pseudouridine synthase [Sciscionella marina]|uniref:pseudouridine synthase n=1 Tax=Sciscionella marina TaxID=508770 RepID=UPI0003668137|nr:pseudouridine synthase [Sciscionella marina]